MLPRAMQHEEQNVVTSFV
uniref:Uncharacterized protein n=1 Tax=Rhizophora mucronata TaxID=61149 RepID=A0A2P2NW39_RHIMU